MAPLPLLSAAELSYISFTLAAVVRRDGGSLFYSCSTNAVSSSKLSALTKLNGSTSSEPVVFITKLIFSALISSQQPVPTGLANDVMRYCLLSGFSLSFSVRG